MTENKRFKLLYSQDNYWLIVDNEKKIDNIMVGNEFQKSGLINLVDLLDNLLEENEQLKQINRNFGDFRNFITEKNVSNEKERKELQLQLLRLYNYFENYFEDTMSPNAFSEMWDDVKEDEEWEKR